MLFIDSFYFGVVLHVIAIAGIVFGVGWIKEASFKWVHPEAQKIKDEDDKNVVDRPMSEQALLMHVTKWSEMIGAEHNAKMTLTGFTITILAALVGFQGEYTFTRGQLWLLAAATITLFIQAALLLWVIRNDREAMYQYTTSSKGRDMRRYTLSVLDGKISPLLQKTILVSLLLVITLVGHRVYGQMNSNKNTQLQTMGLEQEVSKLRAENSKLNATTDNLFDIAQHNADLLQDILSQAEGGLMKTYTVSQRALNEIRRLAVQQREP